MSCGNCIRAGLGDRCRHCVRPLSDRLGEKTKKEKKAREYNEQIPTSQQPVYQSNKQRNRTQRQINKAREREKRRQRPLGEVRQQGSSFMPMYAYQQLEAVPWQGSDSQAGLVVPSHDYERSAGTGAVMEGQSIIERLLGQPGHVVGARWRSQSQSITAEDQQSSHQYLDQSITEQIRRYSF
jgi:hypothetical protein